MSVILTICVPTYNRYEYLHKCLASIESATSHLSNEIEVLVSNNASTDGTSSLLNEWKFSNSLVKFRWITQESNIGPLKNINYLVNHAEGSYLLWCSDDDFITASAVQESIKIIQEEDIDFLRFALVVHDQIRESLYLHALSQRTQRAAPTNKKFIAIYKLTHILTGTLVKKQICLDVPEKYSSNIYPMAAWCSLAFWKVKYSSLPFAVHTYGNEVYWGSDVEEGSVGSPGKQSAIDFLACLELVPEINGNLDLHKEIHKSFQGDYYKIAIKETNLKIRLPLINKVLNRIRAKCLNIIATLRSARR